MKKYFLLICGCLALILLSCSGNNGEPEPTADTTLPEVTTADESTDAATTAAETSSAETETTLPESSAPEETSESETTVEETGYTLCDGTRGEDGYYAYEKHRIHSGTDINYKGNGKNAGYVICIDPGHQLHGMSEKEPNSPGSDVMKAMVTGGTTGSFTGIPEHELNLAVALILRDELISRGYTVVMVRETAEVEISNIGRAEIANKYAVSANVRIHANGSENPDDRGALGICQTADNPANGGLADISYLLTGAVMESFCEKTGFTQKSVWKTDTMTGINWSEVPSTIIEMGYMTNQTEDQIMATEEFRRNAALGIADGIDRFVAAYIPEPDAALEAAVGESFEVCDRIASVKSPVWMRKEPSIRSDDSKIRILYDGETVRVVGLNQLWSRVICGSKIYYVSTKYLE